MDTLGIALTFEEDKQYNSGWFIKQQVWVNHREFKGHLDIATLFEDSTHQSYWSQSHSWSYLDSCSCGHAGCSGIWNGVKIHKKKKAYNYLAKKSDGYPNGILGSGKWSLWFSKENIHEIREHILTFLEEHKDLKMQREDRSLVKYLLNLKEEF